MSRGGGGAQGFRLSGIKCDVMHLHVPYPGELYSVASGSAVVTVIRELAHARTEPTGVLVVDGLPHDARGASLLTFPASRDFLTRRERLYDAACGPFYGRPASQRLHRHALEAVPRDHDGPVFLHNAPNAVRLLRELRPRALPVLYAHNDLFRSWTRHEHRALVEEAHHLVFVSHFLASRFLPPSEWRGKVSVVLNGVDTSRFTPSIASRDVPVVLFVGKVTEHKGVDLLIDACVDLWQRGLDFRLVVVGRHGLSADWTFSAFELALRQRVAGYADRVDWRGFVDQDHLPAVYQEADVFCVPSNWDEPCSLTLPEGLAAGLPIIASNRGGLPEVGRDAVRWFTPPDVAGLAERLQSLLTDASLRRSLGAGARERSLELSWTSRAEALESAVG